MNETNKPRRHYNTQTGQMVWVPRSVYDTLRTLAEAGRRPISWQLEKIITEWLRTQPDAEPGL